MGNYCFYHHHSLIIMKFAILQMTKIMMTMVMTMTMAFSQILTTRVKGSKWLMSDKIITLTTI